EPDLQIIRRSRRPLLRGLEQARRSAVAHHVYRIASMGARVLINGTRYTSLTRPRAQASEAVMGSAVRIIRSAGFRPISRGNRCAPPKGGANTGLVSALQNSARSLAIASGAASVISQPPPWASPLTAAMIGFGNVSILAVNLCPRRTNSRKATAWPRRTLAAKHAISAPDEKARLPAP